MLMGIFISVAIIYTLGAFMLLEKVHREQNDIRVMLYTHNFNYDS
jgi:hypothetical protein